MARTQFNSFQSNLPVVNRQNNTTNTTLSGARMECGWGYITGTGADFGTKAVTFQTAFTSVPIIVVGTTGGKIGGSGIGTYPDAGNFYDFDSAGSTGQTTSGFTAFVNRGGANGGNPTWASGDSISFTWIAIGT